MIRAIPVILSISDTPAMIVPAAIDAIAPDQVGGSVIMLRCGNHLFVGDIDPEVLWAQIAELHSHRDRPACHEEDEIVALAEPDRRTEIGRIEILARALADCSPLNTGVYDGWEGKVSEERDLFRDIARGILATPEAVLVEFSRCG